MDFIYTNIIYKILYYTIIYMSVLIGLLLIFLVFLNLYNYNRQIKKKHLREKYIDWVSSYINDEPIKIADLKTELEFETFTEVASSSLVDLEGEYSLRVKKLTEILKISEYYKKQSKSLSWGKRYNAVEKLGYLKYISLKPFFIEFLDDEKHRGNLKVYSKALIALSLIADKDILYLIKDKIIELKDINPISPKLIEHIYNNAFKVLIKDNALDDIKEFVLDIEQVKENNNFIKIIISSIGNLKIEDLNSNLINYYKVSDNVEIQAEIIRTLGKIGLKESNEIIISALKHPSYIVRTVAAKYAINCGYDALNGLKYLLNDEYSYVRLNAAKTLALLGDKGIDILYEKKNNEDDLVSNTVKHVLDLNTNNILYS